VARRVLLGLMLFFGPAFLMSCSELEHAADRLGIGTHRENMLDQAAPVGGSINEPAPGAASEQAETIPPAASEEPSPKESVELGTGKFFNPPQPVHQEKMTATKDGLVLNFVDADVRDVVRSVMGQTLKLSYVIDPAVKGLVTMQTTEPIPMKKVLPTLEATLALSGIAIVKNDDLYRVVASDAAARGPVVPSLRPRPGGTHDAYGVQIVPLRYVSATEMQKILEPMTRKDGVLRVDTASNLLLLAGTADERQAMSDVVRIFDVNRLAGMSFALVPLKYSETSAVVADLDKVFGESGPVDMGGALRFLPLERMNAVLAVSANPNYLARAREWIARLDVGSPSKDRRTYIYHVQHALAVDLASVLSKIFGAKVDYVESQRVDTSSSGLSQSLVQPVTGRSAGRSAGRSQPESLIQAQPASRAGAATPAGRTTRSGSIAALARNDAADTTRPAEADGIRIIADDTNNSIVVLATPNEFREIEDVLKRMDVTPLQVLIEATIAEVRLDDQLRYGVKWFLESGRASFTLSDIATGAVQSTFPGFSFLFAGSKTRVILDALDSVTDINVISSPQLMVLDNHTADLLVGDQVPVATQSAVSVINPDAPIVNSIEFRDTGVVLRVTPRVNKGGMVNLEIEQEVSDVVPTTTSGIDSPTIRQRRIKSTVAIQSGETVALGGLIRDRRTDVSEGVPFVSHVPVLGALFGSKDNSTEKTELLVLITPRVIHNTEQAREMTNELRDRIDAFKLPKKKKKP
jgi:general secretion pathway protein D